MTLAERAAELALTQRVAKELKRLGLQEHVTRLRQHYWNVRAGRESSAWNHDLSIEWLRLLRLPPHENDYPVRPRMSQCGKCHGGSHYTVTVFPDGSLHACGVCGARWLELG